MIDLKAIGGRIRALRQKRGLTQSGFAEILGVSFQAVSNWERGVAPPELENLVRIAAYFGVPVDELLRYEGERLCLGIDGGGTKTELAVVSLDGTVKARLLKSGCNPNDIGFEAAKETVLEGIRELSLRFPSIKSCFCGIAGISVKDYAKRLSAEIKARDGRLAVEVNNDAFNLFASDGEAEMAVISGTGSVVFVRQGSVCRRLGGWGYLFDRAGSAYDMGREAVRRALAEEDGGLSPSHMSRLLYERLGTATAWDSIKTLYGKGKPYIASLASVVLEAYAAQDENAIRIVDESAAALAALLNMGVERYGASPVAVASGGLFQHHADVMRAHIEKYSRARLHISQMPPIYGACRAAVLLAEGAVSDGFCRRFEESYGGLAT